jgi:hypothetical protein
MRRPTAREFTEAMRELGPPRGRQIKFLKAHYRARGRLATATQLADAAGYRSYGGTNLHYGGLGRRIGRELGLKGTGMELLVEFHEPRSVTNREWILAMRPEFAAALKASGWL